MGIEGKTPERRNGCSGGLSSLRGYLQHHLNRHRRPTKKQSLITNPPSLGRRRQTSALDKDTGNAPSTSCPNADSVTADPPLILILTLYLCQSDLKCRRCSSTSLKVVPKQMLQARWPLETTAEAGSGDGVLVRGLLTRFRGVRESRRFLGKAKTWVACKGCMTPKTKALGSFLFYCYPLLIKSHLE